MKPYIKLLSVFLALTMLLGLCSCGKKEKEGAGMYLCTTIDYGFGDPVEDTEGRYLELRSDGTGTIYYGTSIDLSFDGKWKLRDGELFFKTYGVEDKGTLKDDVIVLDYGGTVYTFVLEGSEAAKNIKQPSANSDSISGTFLACGMYADGEYLYRNDDYNNSLWEGNYIEFNSDGTGTMFFAGDDPDPFTYNYTSGTIESVDGTESATFFYYNGVVTVYFDDLLVYYSADGYYPDYEPMNDAQGGEFSPEFANLYSGDWHGVSVAYDCTGIYSENNGTEFEIIARFIFNDDGSCVPYLAVAFDGANEYNFKNTYVSYGYSDEDGEHMLLGGEFMGITLDTDDSFIQIDPKDSDRLFVNAKAEDDSGNVYSFFACLRPVGDENWSKEDYPMLPKDGVKFYRGKDLMDIAKIFEVDTSLIPTANDSSSGNSGDTGYIDDMGMGYGKSNAYATGDATLEDMRKVFKELTGRGTTEKANRNYELARELLGSDGIPWYDMGSGWSDERHGYKWTNADGDFLYIVFNVENGNELYTSCTYSSNVKEGT